jgi:glycosyltransferase involved in cell wall biosynthesis
MNDRPGLPRVLFFANSSRESTDGRRVREFRARVPCTPDSEVFYRDDHGRLGSVLALVRAARRLRPDLVYVELFGYSGLIGGMLAKALYGCRLGVGNGDEVVSTHLKSGRRLRAAASWTLDALLRRYADLWAVWSPYHARWLRARQARNVVCAPGAVNLREIAPVDPTPLRRLLGLEGRFVIGVVGRIGYSQALDMAPGWDLIEALPRLRDLPVSALIVGDGPGLDRLKALAAERHVADRVVFTGRVPHAALSGYYSLLHAGVVTLSNDLDGKFTWTAKLPEYLACNVFTVMTDIERSRSFVARCGALLPFRGVKDREYPGRLAALVRVLVEHPAVLERRTGGRRIASRLLDFDVAARHLARGIARATGRSLSGIGVRPATAAAGSPGARRYRRG